MARLVRVQLMAENTQAGTYARRILLHASRQTIDAVCLQALGQRAHLMSSELVGCARSIFVERDAERQAFPPEDDQEAKHQKDTQAHMAHVLIAANQQGAALALRVVAGAGAAGTRC